MTNRTEQTENVPGEKRKRDPATVPVILAVTRNGRVSEAVMKYSLDIAERLGYNILVAYVNTLPFLWDGGRRGRFLEKAARENISHFRTMTNKRNIHIASVNEYGKVGKVIHRLCHIAKRVDMVVIDQGIKMDEAAFWSPVPVFNIYCGDHTSSRRFNQAKKSSRQLLQRHATTTAQRSLLKAFFLTGSLTALYFIFFSNMDQIMFCWSQGGVYSLFPALTACTFFLLQNALVETLFSILSQKFPKNRRAHKS